MIFMLDPYTIIDKYYTGSEKLRGVLLVHSKSVTDKALEIAKRHPELNIDERFIYEAGMLHDVGIFKTNAPDIYCHGELPYIAHGYLGADMLREEGFERHALVCERHTGTGLSLDNIMKENLPIPHRDMQPISIEEQVICFADKFFSKTHLDKVKTIEEARNSLVKFGEKGVAKFNHWCDLFL